MTFNLTQVHSKSNSLMATTNAFRSTAITIQQMPVQPKWHKILAMYNMYYQKKQTYQNCPIKPGLSFYRSLLKPGILEKYQLQINLPETLMRDDEDNVYMLYTDKDNRLKKKKTNPEQFEDHIKRINNQLLDLLKKRNTPDPNITAHKGQHDPEQKKKELLQWKLKKSKEKLSNQLTPFRNNSKSKFCAMPQGTQPNSKYQVYTDYRINENTSFVLCKVPAEEEPFLFDKQLYSYKRFIQQKCKPSKGRVIQRFIMSRNLKAMLVRLCYNTKSSEQTHSNFAYRVQNFDPIFKYYERTGAHQTNINFSTIVLNENKQNTFELIKVVGKTLIPYEKMAESLTTFLEKVYSIRIKKLYLDFIVDLNQKIWVTNLKYIALDQSVVQLSKLNLDNQILTCTAYCKLCGMIYKRDQVSKNLTYKLLFELVEHLKKRTRLDQDYNITGVSRFLHDLKFNMNINKPCQLCNLCYLLVVSEHELIEVEKSLAKCVNIKVKDEVTIQINDPKTKKRPAYLPENLKQWRLMLYFSEINSFSYDDRTNLYLQYKINNLHYLGQCLKFPQSTSEKLNINQIKLHYFFSQTINIQKFLNQSEILVRVTQGTDWNKCIAQGSSGTISHFKNKVDGQSGQRHSSTVLLFFEDSKFCQVQLTVGLVCDGTYNTGDINLYKQKEIYLTQNTYHNSNPLPKEWMEMFSPKYALRMMDDTAHRCTYTPVSTYDQIRKMIGARNIKKDNKRYS